MDEVLTFFFLGLTSLYTSVMLLFERWLAVRRSIFYKTRFKIRHMNVLIVTAWILGFIGELPVFLLSEGVYGRPSEICQHTLSENNS